MVDVSVTSSSTRCKIATSNNTCLSCVEGYSLFSDKCMRQESNDYNNVGDAIEDFPSGTTEEEKREQQMRAYYVYKNPIGKNMPKRMTLDINFSNLINSPYITLFFFIKLYGRAYAYNDPESDIELDDNVIEIIRLDDESQLYFGYDFDNENDAFFFSYFPSY